jgi:L-iditol 2-dehydrogenase
VERSPTRSEAARRLGATHAIDPEPAKLVEALRELTGGYGPDVVIECAGTQATWEASVLAVRKGGRVLWFGGLPGGTTVQVDAGRVHYGEIALLGIHGGTSQDAREAFGLITRREVDVQSLLSGELPLEQVEMALQRMRTGEVIKMSINPEL